MKIFIDVDFKCHLKNDGTMREISTDFFDGKCKVWIESYRFVPSGEAWTRSDGEVFLGEMVSPWKPLDEAFAAQETYEYMIEEFELSYESGVNAI